MLYLLLFSKLLVGHLDCLIISAPTKPHIFLGGGKDWGLNSGLHTCKASALPTAKQVLYCLSHTLNTFCSGYFGDRGSCELFAWAGLEL
jgi:hypothetical protein